MSDKGNVYHCQWENNEDNDFVGWLMIVSESFLKLLTKPERDQFEARPCAWSRPCRRKFFEIVPHTLLPNVVIKGHELDGGRCKVCGRVRFSDLDLGRGVVTVSRSDLPERFSDGFFVGDPTYFGFCLPKRRWIEMNGKPGTRKLLMDPVAVVSKGLYVRPQKLWRT